MKVNLIAIILIFCSTNTYSDNQENGTAKLMLFEENRIQYERKLENISDKNLQRTMRSYGYFVLRHELDRLQKEIKPQYTRYANDPEAILGNYNSFEELTRNYIDGVVLTEQERADLEYYMIIREPFGYPFMVDCKWKSALMSNNEIISNIKKFSPLNTSETDSIQIEHTAKSISVKYPSKDHDELPVSLSARYEVKLPSAIHKFRFKKEDLLKTKTIDGIKVTLLDFKNGYTQIKVQTPDSEVFKKEQHSKWLKVAALDKNKRFVAQKWFNNIVTDTSYTSLYNQLISIDEYSSEFITNFKQNVIKREQENNQSYNFLDRNLLYQLQKFAGDIDEVIINICDYRNSKTLKIEKEYQIKKFKPYYRNEKIPTFTSSSVVYDNEASLMLKDTYELPGSEISSKIRISQTPASDEKHSVIKFKYPEILSSKMLYNADRFRKLKEIRFYNKNNEPINIPVDSIAYECTRTPGLIVDFDNARIQYDASRFPEIPCYARGVLKLPLATVKKQTYTIDNLPDGVRTVGSILMVPKTMYGGKRSDYPINKCKVFIKDKTQNYLKCFFESSAVYSNETHPFQDVFYYYGTPHSLEIYTITEVQEIDYSFDIKLTRQVGSNFMPE